MYVCVPRDIVRKGFALLPQALDDDFYAKRPSPMLPFVLEDTVRVLEGAHSGRTGSVVVLDRSGEAPRFLVEFGDGTDELFPATALELFDRDA